MLVLIFLTWDEERFPVEHRRDWQGNVLETLRGSLFASDSRCWQSRLGLWYRAGKPKTGRFYWNEYFLHSFPLTFISPCLNLYIIPPCLSSLPLLALFVSQFLSLSLSHFYFGRESDFLWRSPSLQRQLWLRVMSWWRHDVSHPVSQKHLRIIQHSLSVQSVRPVRSIRKRKFANQAG